MLNDAINSGILDQVTQEFLSALQGDYSNILAFAKTLLYYLAFIQITISVLFALFKSDVMEGMVKVLQLFFGIAVFYTFVLYSGDWMPQVINAFIDIGAKSSGIDSLSPSGVLSQGLSISGSIMNNFAGWGFITHPFGALLSVTIMVAILILYALLAAEMTIIMVKSYTLITVGPIMAAFGAMDALRPMAISYFKAVIGIGLQLMTFYLIMGVGVHIGNSWSLMIGQAAKAHDLGPFLVVMAAVIVFYLVAKNVPPFIAGLSGVSGFRSYGDAAVGAALTAGSMMAGGAGMAARGAAMGAQAMGQGLKGGAQVGMSGASAAKAAASGGASPMQAFDKAVAAGATHGAASMGGAIKDTVMKKNPHMSFGQKFNAKMSERMAASAAQNNASGKDAPGADFKSNNVNK